MPLRCNSITFCHLLSDLLNGRSSSGLTILITDIISSVLHAQSIVTFFM